MSKVKVIYLLEDDKRRREKLVTLLNFVGEEVLAIEQLPDELNSDTTLCVVAGNSSIDLASLAKAHPRIPFLLAAETHQPALSCANVIGPIDDSVDYPELSRWLHYSHAYHRELANRSIGNPSKNKQLENLLVGQSQPMAMIRRMIAQVAVSDANVLVLGESGTGKEVVAQGIHALSERSDGPFVPVNCGAIPSDLLESELFGHEKGAFTGAIGTRKGRFELAQGGTLFLDEIGDMPSAMQVKLLRVLQERTFERVGGSKSIKADVRVVAATHRHLESMIKDGGFREDLYYRLNVFPIDVPALRERQDDVPLLLHELTKRFKKERGVGVRFTDKALESLSYHQWPGNVRELTNLIERLTIMHPDQLVDVQDLPPKYQHVEHEPVTPEYPDELLERDALNSIFADDDDEFTDDAALEEQLSENFAPGASSDLPDDGVNLKDMLSDIETEMIRQALERSDGVVAKAAELLSMRRTTLVEKMKKYQIKV